jgi:hypothetical protein
MSVDDIFNKIEESGHKGNMNKRVRMRKVKDSDTSSYLNGVMVPIKYGKTGQATWF